MKWIDTHTHLYQPAFDGDRKDAMERCDEAGVDLLLLPNIDVKSIPRVRDMMVTWPDRCRGMMGLHPLPRGRGVGVGAGGHRGFAERTRCRPPGGGRGRGWIRLALGHLDP